MAGKMIRVLYDYGGFLMSHGGVSRYFAEMIKRLPKDIEWKLGMESTSNIYLQKPPFNIPPHKQTVHDFVSGPLHGHSFTGVSYVYKLLARLMPRKYPSGELANERAFASSLKTGDFDILHLTNPHPVRNNWKSVVGRKHIVVTVHDLIPEIIDRDKFVQGCRLQLLNDADHIIAVSENTKKDIIRLYGIVDEKISVIYHGYLPVDVSQIEPSKVDAPYLLYIGKRGGYKRFDFFVSAISPLLKSCGMRLFCTGNPFTRKELNLLEQLGIAEKVTQRFVSDKEMMSLLSGAVAFVNPSEYEGFGIPILDAFAARCPVVLSRSSCFPEVAGDAALYFEIGDAESLCSNILLLKENNKVRNEIITRGLLRLKEFSWQISAAKTAEVYRNLLRIKKR